MREDDDSFSRKQAARASEKHCGVQLADHAGEVVLIVKTDLGKLLLRRSVRAFFGTHEKAGRGDSAERFLCMRSQRLLERNKTFKPQRFTEPQDRHLGSLRAHA